MPVFPDVVLSPEELAHCISVTIRGNVLLQEWSERVLGPRRRRIFRRWFFATGVDLSELCGTPIPLASAELTTYAEDRPHMLAVREIEPKLFDAFVPQVERQARKFARRLRNPLFDYDDCFNLGLESLHETIYCYTLVDVPFGAFLARAFRNRLCHTARRRQPLPLSRRHNQLLIAYDRTLARLGAGCRFDDIVQHLGLGENDIRRLREAQIQFHSFSQMPEGERDRLAGLPAKTEADEPQMLVAILNHIPNLRPIERLLLEEALLDPPRGWKTAAADKLGVTKGAVTQALQRGWHKLQQFLGTTNLSCPQRT